MSNLGELGLSSYEEKSYRTLLSLGRATATELAEASDVPKGRIYDVLNGLAARDIVRPIETDPRTYEAVAPDVVADRLLAERQRELDERADRYEALAAEVGPELATAMPAESRFWTAPLGSEEAVSLVGDVFDTAEGTVFSAMSVPYGEAAWDRYAAEMAAFVEYAGTDVEVRTLVSPAVLSAAPASGRESVIDGLGEVSVRVASGLNVSVDLVDDAAAYLHVPHPTDASERLGFIEVQDGSLVETLSAVLTETWDRATPLETALDGASGSPAE